MDVYMCVDAKNGSFFNVFSSAELASEYRRSVEGVRNVTVTIIKAEVDAVNVWEVYYEDES